jgi:hypothetical protein
VGRKNLYNSNSDSGSLRVSLFKINGVPSIALYVGSATHHSQLALLKQGIKKFIIRIRNSWKENLLPIWENKLNLTEKKDRESKKLNRRWKRKRGAVQQIPSTTAIYAVNNSTQHAKSGTIRGDANHGEIWRFFRRIM